MMLGPDEVELPPPNAWPKFQNLARDLTASRLKNAIVQNLGRSGQKQFGIDHYGSFPDGSILAVQCKKKDARYGHKLTVDELHEEVQKAKRFPIKLSRYIIATSARDDAKIQIEAMKITQNHATLGLFPVSVEGWDTINELFGEHQEVSRKYYNYPPVPSVQSNPPAKHNQPKTRLLSATGQRALGLLASIGISMPRLVLQSLVPELDWTAALKELSRARVITHRAEGYSVLPQYGKAIFRSEKDRLDFDEQWVNVLTPYSGYIDLGILLASCLMRISRVSDAISVFADLADSVEPGPWNE